MGRLKKKYTQSSSSSESENGDDNKPSSPRTRVKKAQSSQTPPPTTTTTTTPRKNTPTPSGSASKSGTPYRRLRKPGSPSPASGSDDEGIKGEATHTLSRRSSMTTQSSTSGKKKRLRRLKSGASSSSSGSDGEGDKVKVMLDLTGEGGGGTSSSQRSATSAMTTTQEDSGGEESKRRPSARRVVKRPRHEEEEEEVVLDKAEEEDKSILVAQESPEDIRAKMQRLVEKRTRKKGGSSSWESWEGEEEEDETWAYEDEEDENFIAEEGEVEEEQAIACKCGATEEDEEEDVLWMQCSNPCCGTWHHGRCYGVALAEDVPKKFQCEVCDPEGKTRGIYQGRPALTPDQEKKAKRRRRNLLYKSLPSLELYDLVRESGWGVDDEAYKRFMSLLRKLGVQKANQPVGEFEKRRVTLLMRAAECGNDAAVKALLEEGAEPLQVDKRKRSVLMYAASGGGEGCEVLKMVALAVEGRGKAILKRSLTAVDSDGYNVFHLAAASSTTSTGFKYLWQLYERAGVPAKKVNEMLEEQVGEYGFNPLMLAIEADNEAGIIALIDKHPTVLTLKSASGGMTPLMLAISKGNHENTKIVLQHLSPETLLETDEDQMVSILTEISRR